MTEQVKRYHKSFEEGLPFIEYKEGTKVSVVGTGLTGIVVGCNPPNNTIMVNIQGTVQSIKHYDLVALKTGETMKRYHKSFISLMEQCKDGEWVKNEDFEAAMQVKEEEVRALHLSSTSLIDKWKNLYYKESAESNNRFMQLQQANKTILLYRCVMLFMLVVGIITEVITRFIV